MDRALEDRAQRRDNVTGLGHRGRTLLEQVVRALAARIERGARHSEHLTALLQRHARGDERARSLRRLDHHHAGREPGDQPIAARKVTGARLVIDRHFREHDAVGSN